jgi:hypothetical protein
MSDKELPLTDAQLEIIAEKAAVKALEKVYTEVGKSVLKKAAWLTGVAVIGLVMWLGSHGTLPKV